MIHLFLIMLIFFHAKSVNILKYNACVCKCDMYVTLNTCMTLSLLMNELRYSYTFS